MYEREGGRTVSQNIESGAIVTGVTFTINPAMYSHGSLSGLAVQVP